MRGIVFLLCFIHLVAIGRGSLPAQERAGAKGAPVAEAAERRGQVTFDVVRLFGVEGKTLIEIYSRIPTSALSFRETGGRWEASLAFDLTVKKGEEIVLRDSWKRTKTVADRR